MSKQPNIVIFMTDQQNAQTIKPDHVAITPNIDRFYKKSVVFENAFCSAPHCCPSRATFFSGLYPSQHGVWHNVEVDNAISRSPYDDVQMFPENLRSAGYETIFSGKWHVSAYEGPDAHGFDEVLCERTTNYGRFPRERKRYCNDWEKVYNHPEKIDLLGKKQNFGQISREGYPIYHQFGVDENPFNDRLTVELACDDIRARVKRNSKTDDEQKPFFYYVGTIGPHDPYCPPQEFIDLYKDVKLTLPESFNDDLRDKPNLYRRTRDRFDLTPEEQIESIRRYLAFVSYEDSLFGTLIDTLEETGELENTYVIYLTDHGDYLGAHGLWAKGLPCFREAYNICAMIGGADINEHRTENSLVSIADFAPTILELANAPKLDDIIGKSLVPYLKNVKPETWRTDIFTQTNGNEIYGMQRAVWNNKWKYVLNFFDYDELYDLENDPHEMQNLIENKTLAPIVKECCKKLWNFAKQTNDNSTCPYIMVSLAPYGPGVVHKD